MPAANIATRKIIVNFQYSHAFSFKKYIKKVQFKWKKKLKIEPKCTSDMLLLDNINLKWNISYAYISTKNL